MKAVQFACMFIGLILAVRTGDAAITFSCATNIDATLAGTCNGLNTNIADLYSSTFTNANATIYIQYGTTRLASTLQYFTNVSYSVFASALKTNSLTSNGGDFNDVTAVESLGSNLTVNPVVAGEGVALTSALATALGLASNANSLGITAGGTPCPLGTADCYNAVETLSNTPNIFYYRSGSQSAGSYDVFSAVQHETDEVLGTASCIAGNGSASAITTSLNCTNALYPTPPKAVSAADLFRYSAQGVRSYIGTGGDQANGSLAYFSINSGLTSLAAYNNSPNRADYGDWNSALARVQNAYGTPATNGVNITNDGGSEIAVLDAIGYNLQPASAQVPEPGVTALIGTCLVLFFAYKPRSA